MQGVIFFAVAAACLSAASDVAKPRIVAVNEDNDHYFKLDASLMNEASLKAYIDKMAGGNVTHFFMCPSGQRTSYASEAWDRIWDEYDPEKDAKNAHFRLWATNARSLWERGIDPYQVWIKRCREKGISPWLSPRMNDSHNADVKDPWRSTRFWREHDELHCEPGYRGRDWLRTTFNFAKQPVQDYTFALVKEQLDRYDIDGYELDFMRFVEHFPRGTGMKNAHHLDRFVKRVKNYVSRKAEERGHPILLGVRVATTPKVALWLGCDVGKWVREGWVDWVCASTGWETPDYNMPVAEWRASFGERADKVVLLAGTDHGVNSWVPWGCPIQSMRWDMEMRHYAGFADVQWGNGVDGLYLFNIPYLDRELAEVARLGLFPEKLVLQRRTYPVSYRSETYGAMPNDVQLPVRTDKENELRIRLGANPTGAVSVVVCVTKPGTFHPEVTLNGFNPIGSAAEFLKVRPTGISHKGKDYNCRRYHFPSTAVHGGADNIVKIGKTSEPKDVEWCEIELDPADWTVGADVSWTTEMEKKDEGFKTREGNPAECLQLMRDYGLNAVRLRVWVDPKDGWCGKADTLVKAKRAVAAGMDVMIDFHFSDHWADPGNQEVPNAWRGLGVEHACERISAHVKDVLTALKDAGVEPKWVQVGNETNFGILWRPKKNEKGEAKWVDRGGDVGWVIEMEESLGSLHYEPENYARFFAAGSAAVKAVFPRSQVIVHLAEGEKWQWIERNLETLRKYGATWDMVGLSVYPKGSISEEVGGDSEKYRKVNDEVIDKAIENIARGAKRWGCPFMIVETGAETRPHGSVTIDDSAAFVSRLSALAKTRTQGVCKGLFYWEPECRPQMYDKGAFDETGRPTQIMNAIR